MFYVAYLDEKARMFIIDAHDDIDSATNRAASLNRSLKAHKDTSYGNYDVVHYNEENELVPVS